MSVVKYDDAVQELEGIAKNNWRIGEIADAVEMIYGERTLQTLAADTGINYKTLLNCRTVYRAWLDDDGETSRHREDLAWNVHATFASEEDRFKLIELKDWAVAEAREEVRARKQLIEEEESEEATAASNAIKKGLAAGEATLEALLAMTPAQRDRFNSRVVETLDHWYTAKALIDGELDELDIYMSRQGG